MITERDIEVIQFLHDRLENVYKENKNVDYLIRTREIISKLKEVRLPDVSCPDSSGSVCPRCKGEKWFYSENGFYCEPCRNCGGNGKLTN